MKQKAFDLAAEEGRRPTWEMALLYPDQGTWTEEEYLALDIGRAIDFAAGAIEFRPMPDEKHQAIVFFLVQALKAFASRAGGKATMAPFPMRLWEEKYREPDVLFMKKENLGRCRRKFWDRADLVIEVLSGGGRAQDLKTKRLEYAKAGIPEYWIVDSKHSKLTVLVLDGASYSVGGEFVEGETAASRVLPGFEVDVEAALAAE
jgi:Uma2 family endonuclease